MAKQQQIYNASVLALVASSSKPAHLDTLIPSTKTTVAAKSASNYFSLL
jgi:hypothetical protein